MGHVGIDTVDLMIKEYLIFRGFPATLKSFESQLKNDKSKSFKIERIVECFSSFIHNYDIVELRKYWIYFDKLLFSKLGYEPYKVIKKLENRVLRLYVVHALQNNKPEKVSEFFEKYVHDLQGDDSWKDWFVIPFIKAPEQNKMYSIYFTKIWQDSVMASLANCLNTVLSSMTLPSLLDFDKENRKLKHLMEENEKLKDQIIELGKQLNQSRGCTGYAEKSVQTEETLELDDDVETSQKSQKRNSSVIKGKFPWKILGSKDKDKDNKDINSKDKEHKDTINNKSQELIPPRKPTRPISVDESIPKKVSEGGSNSVVVSKSLGNQTDDLIHNTSKIQFQTNHYASSETRDATSLRENISVKNPDNSSSMGPTDSHADAPFIILNQSEFSEHNSPIITCSFSRDNNLVASLDLEGCFKVWECYPSVSQVSKFTTKGDMICLDWVPKSNDKILMGKSNGLLSLQDVTTRKVLWEASMHQVYKRVAHVKCNPVSTSAVCSAVLPKSDVRTTTTTTKGGHNTQQKLIKMKQYPGLSSETNTTRQGIILHWDLQTGQCKGELCLDPYPVYIHSMDYNHNGTLLVTGGADGMVRLFDIRNSDCLIGWHAHNTEVLDVVFNPDETSIYSIAADGKVCVWDINKVSSKIAEFPLEVGCTGMHHYRVNGDKGGRHSIVDDIPSSKLLACDSDGQHMMTCGPSGLMIYRVNPATKMDEAMHVLCRSSEVLTLDWACTPNSSTVMAGTMNGIIQVSTLIRK